MIKKYLTQIRDLLQANIPDTIVKYYYLGEPRNISSDVAEFGFIILMPQPTVTTVADNWNDAEEVTIDIIVGVQSRLDNNYISEVKSEDEEALLHAIDVAEGVDDAGQLKTNTVKYILRNRITSIGLNQSSLVTDYSNQRDENYIYAIKLSTTIYDQRQR